MVAVYLMGRAVSTTICIFLMKSVRTEDGSFLITVLAQGCCVWLDLTLFHVLNTQQTVNEAMLSAPHSLWLAPLSLRFRKTFYGAL